MQVQTVENCDDAAIYFPLMNGRYEVKPGMLPFGSDLGNSRADKQVFQIDNNYHNYRETKLLARRERLGKYYQTCKYSKAVAGAIARLIIQRLVQEHPQHFEWQQTANTRKLHSYLTQETLYLNSDWELLQVSTPNSSVFPNYASTFDALATQIQEDLTVICRRADGSNWLSAVHLCYPNHWSAEEKIGRDFAAIHAPVAGMEKINRRSDAIINTMITRKPTVRFAWGLSTDTCLNHHPEPPPHISPNQWQGRAFDLQSPKLYLRIERQVIWGLPEWETALFTIRTYFRDCSLIKQDSVLCSKLYNALESMTVESLVYKGLIESRDSILQWLISNS
ncbi:heme-dependent oxidative N-demethylase family protein [Anabaena sp. CCY 9910]|uniref:heme-dependent oxidative N-demethylase family protein n=1 Tax=Anabaena sp. CCY 9910 TaxID=3103870 RepID=UPI0039E08897